MRIRRATHEDSDFLLAWRNDPDTRAHSFDSREISHNEHETWLAAVLSDSARCLFVAEVDGVPVGTVRADLREGWWELSWTVAPEARGHGIGRRMVTSVLRYIDGPVRARLKSENRASARIAQAAGMRLDDERDGVIYLSSDAFPDGRGTIEQPSGSE